LVGDLLEKSGAHTGIPASSWRARVLCANPGEDLARRNGERIERIFMPRAANSAYSSAKWSVCMSQHHIALFTFTLGSTESISPIALRALWANASGSGNVSVGRKNPEGTWRDRPIYTLYAPQSLSNLQDVETRLRRALENAHLHATLTGLH
jgi:hypothetical protein